jgi:hypothetical protein
VVDCFNRIVFFKTPENKADMFTKNMSGEAYDEHIDKYTMDHKDITRNGWTAWEGVRITAVGAAAVLPLCVNVMSGEISPVVLCKIICDIESNLWLEGVIVVLKTYAELY